ncbi:arabinose-5-phosphate isomerase [Methanolobus vulcani]|jgi:KpsF/GutQ family protein|uniref:Arabinose-5-phosphate isomerase n=1 Tax=Methanolobus vulcani TaxID=38026 RepID=A0A7Z7AVJ3_9EURY|nr:KpsF/GutQ family sugar-phosphate isomerase [Methanolobus vulcani]SDF58135.1 arabinose-5-phosphate isomerase [Methanolobus vulcani]
MDYIEEGAKVLNQEAKGLFEVADKLNGNFEEAINTLSACEGRVIITGIGKSGIIGRKIASTLASTGTPAFFLHPSEASHGDMGMVTNKDIVILISNSGETGEILHLLPSMKSLGVTTISMCGKKESTLFRECDISLNIGVSSEADPNNLAPTTSTTAALAMGDALAIVLLKLKKFQPTDFAKLHPGGSLGRKLTVRVSHLMHKGDSIPTVRKDATIKEVILVFTKSGLGVAAVVDEKDALIGVFTDGDLRRLIDVETDFINIKIGDVMKSNPKVISPDELAFDALRMMNDYQITALMVTEQDSTLVGILNIHDILKAGIS